MLTRRHFMEASAGLVVSGAAIEAGQAAISNLPAELPEGVRTGAAHAKTITDYLVANYGAR